MSIFSKILAKLGFGDDKKAAANPAPTTTTTTASAPSAPPPKPTVAAISDVDVVTKLTALANSNPEKLSWKVSIVDLLKLLDLDSTLTARKELATELGCPTEKMGDSAQMNIWLHKAVLKKLAENGGNIPADLLD